MTDSLIGWDIGGAHLKAAVVDERGVITGVFQRPCALWKGLRELEQAATAIINEIGSKSYRHALTMTGELADLFGSRSEGVEKIVAAMEIFLRQSPVLVFAGNSGFISSDLIKSADAERIASANWLASAKLTAAKFNAGLFVDIGSTTTDILLFQKGKVEALGMTDFQRLCSQELIYTGLVRTPIMSICCEAIFKDKQVGLMAEYFATMADVYRLTGELNELHDQTPSADGADKTPECSARRLARMIGCDLADAGMGDWIDFARFLRNKQLEKIRKACEKQLSRHASDGEAVMVGAGVGRFLVKELAETLGVAYFDFSELLECHLPGGSMSIADCAPAAAVGYLAKQYAFVS